MSEEIDRLKARIEMADALLLDAKRALAGIERKVADEGRERTEAFRRELQADLDAKYGAHLKAALDVRQKAQEELDAASVAKGEAELAEIGDPRRVEWRVKGNRWDGFSRELSGSTGILEVCRPGTIFPANVRWRIPHVGEIFIRKNKANGQPGTLFAAYRENDPEWRPIDWGPPAKAA